MEQFGQRLAILSLCLLAAVVISEQKLPKEEVSLDDDICSMYMQGKSRRLNMSEEFGWDTQTGNVTLMTELFQRSDRNYDGYLIYRKSIVFIGRVIRIIG